MKLSQEFIINLETQVEKLKDQLNKLENAKPIDELTVTDVYEMNPELRDQVHQMIRDDHWAVSDESSDKKQQVIDKESPENIKEKLNYL